MSGRRYKQSGAAASDSRRSFAAWLGRKMEDFERWRTKMMPKGSPIEIRPPIRLNFDDPNRDEDKRK